MREQLISENVSKVVAATIVTIGLVIASTTISGAIRDAGIASVGLPDEPDPGDAPYQLTIQDGYLYMTNGYDGVVFKRLDAEGAEWEQVPSLPY